MRAVLTILLVLSLCGPAAANPDDWAEGSDSVDDGATRDFYNRGAGLAWRQQLGDWTDRDGAMYGGNTWASTRVDDTDTARYVEWDVTDLVNAGPSQGFFLRAMSGGGPIVFASREGASGQHPELVVVTSAGTMTLAATSDTHLVASTFQSHGDAVELRVRDGSNHLLVRFDLSGVASVTSATLRLYTTEQFGGGLDIGVFVPATGVATTPALETGLADGYERDAGIAAHADVVLFEDFEASDWMDHWTTHGGDFEVIDGDSAFGFSPLVDRALRVLLPEGGNTALNTRFDFMAETGAEPESIYLRYYLRFGTDWNQTVDGGKLPGISGTYGVAGWGGRRSDGTNGWSARGLFRESVPRANNPLAGRTPIGSYVYHADMLTSFGDNFLWVEGWDQNGFGGVIEQQRWVCLEVHVEMNTPGANDGIIRAWVDGRRSLDLESMRFRDVASLRIERIWMNVFHGGTAASPYDQHLFIDNVVIASSYIGPMGGAPVIEPDAGPRPMTDAAAAADGGGVTGPDGGGSPDGGGTPPDDAGCSCRAAARPEVSSGVAGLLLIALLVLRRRWPLDS